MPVEILSADVEDGSGWTRRREGFEQMAKGWYGDGLDAAIQEVSNRQIPSRWEGEILVRVYHPVVDQPGGRLPVLVYAHGGGWLFGSLDSHDGLCRRLCHAVGCIIVSVDYRQPPEHVFPAPLEDVYSAACWAVERAGEFGGDPHNVGIGGDSAGGNLAAAVCLIARERSYPRLVQHFLYCPVMDYPDPPPASHLEPRRRGDFLFHETMVLLYNEYVLDVAERSRPLASPLRAPSVEGLPPAIILTAEHDILRDEGHAYAARLREARVPVVHACSPGLLHTAQLAFGAWPGEPTDTQLAFVAQELRKGFSSGLHLSSRL